MATVAGAMRSSRLKLRLLRKMRFRAQDAAYALALIIYASICVLLLREAFQ